MIKTMLLLSAAIIGSSILAANANAQGPAQSVEIASVDIHTVAAGYRATAVIGTKVLNDRGLTIGRINDLLVTREGNKPYAVLWVGGFLGLGERLVVVRYDSLQFTNDNKIVLPGVSKESLKMLPAFAYTEE
jgi:hypothetical protein